MGVGLILLALIISLVWLLARVPEGDDYLVLRDSSDVDYDELEEAERELEELSYDTTPDDAEDELKDWGPGAPKA